MKKEVMELWVAALRSGEYKQGQARLRSHDNTFCCLGVLCDIAVKQNVENVECYKYDGGYGNYNYNQYFAHPPFQVREWAGLQSKNGCIGLISESLTNLNDTGSAFNQIADIIEKHWEEL